MPSTLLSAPARQINASALLIAWRNLTHDRARFAVTMVGIVFAVILIALEGGLFLGFSDTITKAVLRQRADVWVMARGTKNFDIAQRIRERDLYRVRSLPGVERAERLIVQFANWKKPGGGGENMMVVGFNPNDGLAGPWNVVAGDLADLRLPDTVMVDELFKDKLGVHAIGDIAEVNGHRARVVGFTREIRSFTTSPLVFASFKNALQLANYPEDGATYVLLKTAPGIDPEAVAERITATMPELEARSARGFAKLTETYWMYTTGAGSSVILGAALAAVVGVVIVAQVLYATTMDHLWEFGTLRAMGAPSSFIVRIILAQATIAATLGYAVGIVASLLLMDASRKAAALILIPPGLAALLFVVSLGMCTLASLVSIRKVLQLDPVMVFQR
ncbi:MAG TPA: ABC transporter permease [Magnetospirillum sp.]|jgi:putative ABC transport system permease protein|nr:ABC transporter permease [Magnetospirillum sp.]